jgi:SSS family solute:Na+ symporter
MYVMHLLGVKFSRFTPAQIEGISLLFLLCFPFVAVLLVGAMTRPMDKDHLDRFYGKLNTPVGDDHAADEQAMKETMANPTRFDHTKVFPRSNWEFTRQPSYDIKGMCIGVTAGLVLIGLLLVLARLGV